MKTSIYPPVIALGFVAGIWLLNQFLPLAQIIYSPWDKLAWLFWAFGFTLDLWSLYLFHKQKTTPHPLRPEKASSLVISGFYRLSRNPMYLGLLLLLAGYTIYLGALSGLLLLFLFIPVMNYMQIRHEEKALEMVFGKDYLDYKNKVRRWI